MSEQEEEDEAISLVPVIIGIMIIGTLINLPYFFKIIRTIISEYL
tara:strand:+ start:73 stop:207 length:135 start_codon:yes stop_codon:yes gene_type:complete